MDSNYIAETIIGEIGAIIDYLSPEKLIQHSNKYAPWLTEATKDMIDQRNEAQKAAVASKNLDDWRQFKNLRNTAKSRMRVEKKLWEKQKLDNTKHNPSVLWQNIKGWLSWNNSGPPSQLFYLGRMITSPPDLATGVAEPLYPIPSVSNKCNS